MNLSTLLKLGVPAVISLLLVSAILNYAPALAEGIHKATLQHEYILNGVAEQNKILRQICINTSPSQADTSKCL